MSGLRGAWDASPELSATFALSTSSDACADALLGTRHSVTDLTNVLSCPDHPRLFRNNADCSVGLQDGELYLSDRLDAVLAHRHYHLLPLQSLLAKTGLQELPLLDQYGRRSFDQAAPDAAVNPECCDDAIDHKQYTGCKQPTLDGYVPAHHCVLDGVGNQKDYHEVKYGHLPQLTLAHQAQADKDTDVHE